MAIFGPLSTCFGTQLVNTLPQTEKVQNGICVVFSFELFFLGGFVLLVKTNKESEIPKKTNKQGGNRDKIQASKDSVLCLKKPKTHKNIPTSWSKMCQKNKNTHTNRMENKTTVEPTLHQENSSIAGKMSFWSQAESKTRNTTLTT